MTDIIWFRLQTETVFGNKANNRDFKFDVLFHHCWKFYRRIDVPTTSRPRFKKKLGNSTGESFVISVVQGECDEIVENLFLWSE